MEEAWRYRILTQQEAEKRRTLRQSNIEGRLDSWQPQQHSSTLKPGGREAEETSMIENLIDKVGKSASDQRFFLPGNESDQKHLLKKPQYRSSSRKQFNAEQAKGAYRGGREEDRTLYLGCELSEKAGEALRERGTRGRATDSRRLRHSQGFHIASGTRWGGGGKIVSPEKEKSPRGRRESRGSLFSA